MFEKYLSLLPYNPGLIHQMGFYGRRMREEATLRRTGMIFIVLAFMVQFFAVISPPAATLAATGPSNDLINKGFHKSLQNAIYDCNNNVQDYKNILGYYGISCKNLVNAPWIQNFAYDSHGGQLFSMGRWDYPKPGERPVQIDGQTYYVRYLDSWGDATDWALRVIANDGTTYWLLNGCGNLVSVGVPKPPVVIGKIPPTPLPKPKPTPPHLFPVKTTEPGYPEPNSSVAPGTTLGYRIYVDNTGGTDAKNADLRDTLPADTTFVSQSQNAGAKTHTYDAGSRTAEWTWDTISKQEQNDYAVTLIVKVNPKAANGETICNQATVTGTGLPTTPSSKICMKVVVNAPPTPPTPPVPPTPPLPCAASTGPGDTQSCIVNSKAATNLTENIVGANNTTAQPGDQILYTLSAQNTSQTDVASQYVFNENLGDVMVYADPTDLHGGTLDSSTDVVTWPAVDIPAGGTAIEEVTVTVKNPLPTNAPDPANPGANDLIMTNIFGNTININLTTPPAQPIVTASAALPNTGPGTDLFIFAAVMVVGSYFYSRARLLSRESALAVKEASIG